MADPTLLTISGSLRRGAYNRMLLREAGRVFGPARVVEADIDLPLYNGDREEADGVPEKVRLLAEMVSGADAIAISSPEYNKGITGAMKNALDWVSRVPGGAFRRQPTVVMSANAGRTGGETGQFMLLSCLVPLQADILPGPMLCVASAENEFDADGQLTNDRYLKLLTEKMEALRARLS